MEYVQKMRSILLWKECKAFRVKEEEKKKYIYIRFQKYIETWLILKSFEPQDKVFALFSIDNQLVSFLEERYI